VKQVEVLGKKYDIVRIKEDSGMGNLGAAVVAHQKIFVRDDIGPDQVKDTLLHEIIHLVDQELKIGLEEEDVARLACGLYSAKKALKELLV
jgi:hypothetical protein